MLLPKRSAGEDARYIWL